MEAKLKMLIGELQFIVAALQTQLEAAQARIKELEGEQAAKVEKPVDE